MYLSAYFVDGRCLPKYVQTRMQKEFTKPWTATLQWKTDWFNKDSPNVR